MKKIVCPNCQSEMKFVTFAKAPTPWHLKCADCGSKLKPKRHTLTAVVIGMLLGAVVGFFLKALAVPLVPAVISIVAVVVAFEFLAFALARAVELELLPR